MIKILSEKIKILSESLEKNINESKELLKEIEEYDKNKKYKLADEIFKEIDDRKKENIKKSDEVLKEYYAREAQRASEKAEKFNKMINDNLDMSNEKSEMINRLKELYQIIQLYYLNKIDDNLEKNEGINNTLINSEINELERKLRDLPKKSSGMFILQKSFIKLLTLLAQLYFKNNTKKLKNDIEQLINNLYDNKQITKQIYNNLIEAITYKTDS